jgi:hypothetical protein
MYIRQISRRMDQRSLWACTLEKPAAVGVDSTPVLELILNVPLWAQY